MAPTNRRFMVIAHRGASRYEPENTLKAVLKAIELGADGVEIDIRFSAEGVPVVIHDSDLRRVAGISRSVSEMRLEELKRVRVFGREPIPTLEEVMDAVAGRVLLILDVKDPGHEDSIAKILSSRGYENVVVASFLPRVIRRFRQLLPRVATALYTFRRSTAIRDASSLGIDVLLLRHNVVTSELVSKAHRLGIKVITWVVNDLEEARRQLSYGVDGFFTDFLEIRSALLTGGVKSSTL
ncbi:MAG: hypothetical protein DRO39_04745 [Thermoprotei archaeon]|nr:MAG: hypothetical protein DRO39_04745 [Thermoprotei archaeon]